MAVFAYVALFFGTLNIMLKSIIVANTIVAIHTGPVHRPIFAIHTGVFLE